MLYKNKIFSSESAIEEHGMDLSGSGLVTGLLNVIMNLRVP
jgi:hypothetical protein